jgi:hypothetical protein
MNEGLLQSLKFVNFEFYEAKSQKTPSRTLELAVYDRYAMNSVCNGYFPKPPIYTALCSLLQGTRSKTGSCC